MERTRSPCEGRENQEFRDQKPVNACGHTYMEPQTSNTRSRGLGRRIHGSVEDTKLSTNKQHCLSGGEQGYPARVSKVMTQPLLLRETDTCMLDIVQERVSRVSPASAGQRRGDVELRSYLQDAAGRRSLVFDLSMTHDRFGSSSHVSYRIKGPRCAFASCCAAQN